MSQREATPEEKQSMSMFGVINAAIQHPLTDKGVKMALITSTLQVLDDEQGIFGFKGTDVGHDLKIHLLMAVKKLAEDESKEERVKDGNDILSKLNLN